jgi:acylphosphatase
MVEEELARVEIIVVGRVQGVFFRASTLERAQSLSLYGSVRNLSDGSVEIMAEGPRYALEDLVTWAKEGPPEAIIEDTIVRWRKPTGEFRSFRVVG